MIDLDPVLVTCTGAAVLTKDMMSETWLPLVLGSSRR
jgi:hypothetical protein